MSMTISCCTDCTGSGVTVGVDVGVALGADSKTGFWAIESQALIVKNIVHVIRRLNVSLLFKMTLLVCVFFVIVLFYNSILFL
jgi:hypothetical protein